LVKKPVQETIYQKRSLNKSMKCTGKTLSALFTIAFVGMSLLQLASTTSAQLPSRPSIPDFTLALTNHSYDVPNSTSITIDQTTGNKVVETSPGYHVENKTIDIMVQNPAFTPQVKPNHYSINLYYDVRFKGNSETNWTELYHYDEDTNNLEAATLSAYTIISLPQDYFSERLVDFQVAAINATQIIDASSTTLPFYYWRYQASGWSDIHTLDLFDGQVTITQYVNPEYASSSLPAETPTFSPTIVPADPEFPFALMLILVILALLAVGITVWKKLQCTKRGHFEMGTLRRLLNRRLGISGFEFIA
jgi:hypothetical protein